MAYRSAFKATKAIHNNYKKQDRNFSKLWIAIKSD